ncbi:prepilin-type N-terminal cleavage/methylation domain-containing protein [Desulfonema magnum]|uniref:Prepilin-type cleavage/methylation domain-containing protein n=1 Tax=Desulfonema magnum TaxID=45655 RepID=A0A975GT75_9BACT|nr:prepilin-type N-terminal cleavage/methylation domain-containing protein [Desulfonema magnum]QTA92789.1 Prepilin-type cleavage/methylation domain-containing protein [Desulfonema magnum]
MITNFNKKGFTLLELLVVLAVSAIVMTGIYSAYINQQKAYLVQKDIVDIRQKLRGAMFIMQREIKMAGFDHSGGGSAGVITASENEFSFTFVADQDEKDNNQDGEIDEAGETEGIKYAFYTSEGIKKVGRAVMSSDDPIAFASQQPLAEYVDAVRFIYLDGDNEFLAYDSEGLTDQIRAVVVILVGRSEKEDIYYKDTKDYIDESGKLPEDDNIILPAPNDHFRRWQLTSIVQCRNLGLGQ